MLVVAVIVAVLYPAILKLVENSDIKSLKETNDLDLAIKIRRKIKVRRIVILVLMLLCYTIFEIVMAALSFDGSNPNSYGVLIRDIGMTGAAMIICLIFQNRATKAVGKISTLSKHDFLTRHQRYALYLRAFESDNYNHEPVLTEGVLGKFSEYEFTSIISQNIPICAVGMTKEIDCPRGAIRVYLNDENWKDDVLELMSKSQSIYIYVDDRKSCIWEIEQSMSMLEKITFIVDDVHKYNNAISQLNRKLELPKLTEEEKKADSILIVKYISGAFNVKSYRNDLIGYASFLDTKPINIPKQKKSKESKELITGGCLILTVFLIILCSVLYILSAIYSDDNEAYPKVDVPQIHNIHNVGYGNIEFSIDKLIEQEKRMCISEDLSSYTIALVNVTKQETYIEYTYFLNEQQISLELFEMSKNQFKDLVLNNMPDYVKQLLIDENYGIKNIYIGSTTNKSIVLTIEPYEFAN